jgi:hypothetical protein
MNLKYYEFQRSKAVKLNNDKNSACTNLQFVAILKSELPDYLNRYLIL